MDILLLPEKVKNIIALGESHFREFKSCQEGPPTNKTKRNPKEVARHCNQIKATYYEKIIHINFYSFISNFIWTKFSN
jgi:ATP-dependent DNA helicase RecG